MSQNCEMQGRQWYEEIKSNQVGTKSNRLNPIFANKGNCGKVLGASLYYLK